MRNFKKLLAKTNKKDLNEAQTRDFEQWNFELSCDIQQIADKVSDKLNDNIPKKNKLIVYMGFIMINDILAQIKNELD